MLRNLFFNNVHDSLTSEFAQRDFVKQRKIHLYISIYADDIAIVLIHPDPKILQRAAVLLKRDTEKVLGQLKMNISEPKCNNLVISPGGFIGKIFRRNSGLTKTAQNEAHKRDERIAKLAISLQGESEEEGIFPEECEKQLPYTYRPVIKILGMFFGEKLGFVEHANKITSKAIVRHGVMAQLASLTWGLIVGV